MNDLFVRFWGWLQQVNLWKVFFVVLFVYFGVGGYYTDGLYNALMWLSLVWTLYEIGYHSALRELVDKAEK